MDFMNLDGRFDGKDTLVTLTFHCVRWLCVTSAVDVLVPAAMKTWNMISPSKVERCGFFGLSVRLWVWSQGGSHGDLCSFADTF